MKNADKVLIIHTTGKENIEKATLPFVIATAMQASDMDVTIVLQSNAVWIAKKGEASAFSAPGLMPLDQLLNIFLETGGSLLICSPCIRERGITQDQLVEGAQTVAAGTVVDEIQNCSKVISY